MLDRTLLVELIHYDAYCALLAFKGIKYEESFSQETKVSFNKSCFMLMHEKILRIWNVDKLERVSGEISV